MAHSENLLERAGRFVTRYQLRVMIVLAYLVVRTVLLLLARRQLKEFRVALNRRVEAGGKMSKPLFGLVLGGVLGILDGLTAYFTPEVRNQLSESSSARPSRASWPGCRSGTSRARSIPCRSASCSGSPSGWIVAAMPDANGKHYYFEIMLPGALVGAIVGYATQKYRASVTRTA